MFRFGKIFKSVAVCVNILQFMNVFSALFLNFLKNQIWYNIYKKTERNINAYEKQKN